MRVTHRSRLVPIAAFAVLAALPPVLATLAGGRTMVDLPAAFHLVVVGVAGALAAVAAAALAVAGARLRDGRAVLVGSAFATMALLLVIHALATPGVLIGDNGTVQLAGALNLPAGGLILALGALPALRRPLHVERLLAAGGALLALLAAGGALAIADPGVLPTLPAAGSPPAYAVLGAGCGAFALLAWRAGTTYLLTRRRGDLAVVVGVVWLAVAQYGLLTLAMMDLGWWIAHVIEVAGIALVGVPVALDLFRGAASRPLIGDLRAGELVAREEAFLGARVRALMVRLAEKDAYTEGHTRRVAAYAAAIGEELRLPPARLRLLALGGLLHDMGKLAVPDAILSKPGRLTDDEFAVIRSHPRSGRELLGELGGFPELVLRLVESHHERLDGRGYPHGADADTLELEVRILTAADVYDALVSTRVYREAWTSERALGLLRDEAGSAFDPACVAALERVLDRDGDDPAFVATLAPPAETVSRPPSRSPARR